MAAEMPSDEQLLYADIDHLRARDSSCASVTKNMEPSQCSDHERAGADAAAHGQHQELWRIP